MATPSFCAAATSFLISLATARARGTPLPQSPTTRIRARAGIFTGLAGASLNACRFRKSRMPSAILERTQPRSVIENLSKIRRPAGAAGARGPGTGPSPDRRSCCRGDRPAAAPS